jgi:acetyl esterase/lipase
MAAGRFRLRRRAGALAGAALPGTVLVVIRGPADLLYSLLSLGGLEITRDLAYGDGPRRRLDVYRPRDAAGAHPVVVFFYGGAWQGGSKAGFGFVASALARRGHVVVMPDYRLHPEVAFPDFLTDAAAAVAWTRAHAGAFGGDPRALFVAGHSAGAYLAVMLALDARWLAAAGSSRAHLAGAIGLAGPYDFLPLTRAAVKPIFEVVPDLAVTQPIRFADGRNPPLLLLTGDADETVRPRNSAALAARVRAEGGPVETRVYPGVGHAGIVLAFAPLFRGRAPVLADVAGFIAAHRPR